MDTQLDIGQQEKQNVDIFVVEMKLQISFQQREEGQVEV